MDEKRLKEKLSGRTRYPINVSSKNLVYIRIVKSPVKSGVFHSIGLPELPENYGFLGADSIPGKNWISLEHKGMPLFAENEILFEGQFLGVVFGPNPAVLEKILYQISLDIEKTEGFPPLELSERDHIACHRDIRKGQPENFLENENYLSLEDYFEFEGQESHNLFYPQSCCLREGNKFTVHCVTQWPWIIEKHLCSLLKIKKEQILFKSYPCENNHDNFLLPPLFSALISSLVSFHSRKASTLLVSPGDSFLTDYNSGKTILYYQAAMNSQGILQALKLDFKHDCGAYSLMDEETLNRICLAASGVYQCRDIEITGSSQKTNHAPSMITTDGGFSPVFTALEILTSQLAEKAGLTPLEWKARNILRKGNSIFTGFSLTKDPKLDDILEWTVQKSDFSRKFAAYQYHSSHRNNPLYSKRRGIGLSLSFTGNGFVSPLVEWNSLQMKIRLEQDSSLHIYLPFGPGHSQLFKCWISKSSEILELDEKDIHLYFIEDITPLSNGPAGMGRNVTVLHNQLQQGLMKISKRRFRDPLPLEENIRFRKSSRKWNIDKFEGMPFQHLSWGAAVVEIEYDLSTNDIEVLHYWSCLDCGTMLFPPLKEPLVDNAIKHCKKWLKYSHKDSSSNLFRQEEPVSTTVELFHSGTQSKVLDGLTQCLFPSAFMQALIQARGRNQHFIPVDFSEENRSEA